MFKTLRRKRKRRKTKERIRENLWEIRESVEKYMDKKLEKVKFFPESKEEYERFVGYKTEIINTGDRELGVTFRYSTLQKRYFCMENLKRKKQLLKAGIETLVNCGSSADFEGCFGGGETVKVYYGLPVKKAEQKPFSGA